MNQGSAGRLVATVMALAAFAVAVIAGLSAGNPATLVLGRALACMIVCQAVGTAVGSIGERVVREHLESRNVPAPAVHAGARPVHGEDVVRSEKAAPSA